MQRCSDAGLVLGAPDGARSGLATRAPRPIRAAGALRNGRCGNSCHRQASQVKRGGARHAQAISDVGNRVVRLAFTGQASGPSKCTIPSGLRFRIQVPLIFQQEPFRNCALFDRLRYLFRVVKANGHDDACVAAILQPTNPYAEVTGPPQACRTGRASRHQGRR